MNMRSRTAQPPYDADITECDKMAEVQLHICKGKCKCKPSKQGE